MAEEADDSTQEYVFTESTNALWTLERKARWNASAPISKLPQEVLLQIFSYHRDEVLRRSDFPMLLSITHAFRLFRSISLNCPSLWTNIVLSSSEWTQVMLARAGTVPLEIDARFLTFQEHTQRHNLCIVLSHLLRIRILSLIGMSTISRDVMAALIAHPAPLLESFTCGTDEEISWILPDDIFQRGQVPRLKELLLIGCNFRWTSPLFRNSLTSLSLRCGDGTELPSMSTLLDVLRRMPLLERLDLVVRVFPSVTSSDTELIPLLNRRVPLLHLQDLHVEGNVLDCYEFARHLIIPPSSSITTGLYHDDETDYTSSFIAMCAITKLLCLETTPGAGSLEPEVAPILALRVMDLGGGGLEFEAVTDIEEGPGAEWGWKHVKYNMSFVLLRHEFELCSMLLILMSEILPLSSLKNLSIRGEFWLRVHDWNRALISKLNSLHMLQIKGPAIFGFIEVIKTTIHPLNKTVGTLDTTTQTENLLPSPFMPRLTSLWIEHADLMANFELFNGLVDVLKYRKEVEYLPLHTSNVKDCNVHPWQVDELSRWVLHPTKWDQRKHGMDKFSDYISREALWEEEDGVYRAVDSNESAEPYWHDDDFFEDEVEDDTFFFED